MAKFPMAWHRSVLENMRGSLARKDAQLAQLQAQVAASRVTVCKYEAQITEAERRGLDEFDPERFGVKRKAKS